MVKKTYQVEINDEKNIAKAIKANAHVSLKYSTEMVRELKGKPVDKAEKFLQRILAHEDFLPLRKYVKKIGHRKGKTGTATGKFPEKICKAFLELIASAKANAINKGLDEKKLIIQHMFASEGYRRVSYQSKGKIGGKRRHNKSTHIEIIVREAKGL